MKKRIIPIFMAVLMCLPITSCFFKRKEEIRKKASEIKCSEYEYKTEYRYTTPEKDISLFKVDDLNKWVRYDIYTIRTKRYDRAEWLKKRTDIRLSKYNGRKYRAIDGSYEVTLPFLSSSEMYFSDSFYKDDTGRRESSFVLIDENDWFIAIHTSEIMKNGTYTNYYDLKSPDEAVPLEGEINKVKEIRYADSKGFITRYYRNKGDLVFEGLNNCPGDPLDLWGLNTSDAFCNCCSKKDPKELKRYIEKNGYMIQVRVHAGCLPESQGECDPVLIVNELLDYIMKNMKYPKPEER